MDYWNGKRAIVTGGSSGLGRAIARALANRGARVAIVARTQQQLDTVAAELQIPLPVGEGLGEGAREHGPLHVARADRGSPAESHILPVRADVTQSADVTRMANTVGERFGGVDFFCHAAGRSMRGELLTTPPDEFRALWEINTLAAVQCIQALAASLKTNRGHIALIGSLASKVAPRYLGAYPASKFPLAALAQQLRLELGPQGIHTLLVCPGPIARDEDELFPVGGVSDADFAIRPTPSSASETPPTASRYAEQSADLPPAAALPAGGAKVKAIDPHDLARRILRACQRRDAELIVPGKARLLFALAQLSPRLGDWLLSKNMKSD